MKKIILGLLALSTASFAATGDISIVPRVGIGVTGQYDDAPQVSQDTDGIGVDIALEGFYSVSDNFDVGLGVGYLKHADRKADSFNWGTGSEKTSGAEYDSIPLYVTTKYYMMKGDAINSFLKLDLGYAFNTNGSDFEKDGKNYSTDIDNGFYWALGGGIEWNNVVMDLMYTATHSRVDVKDEDDSFDNNYGELTLSLGYKFNL
jgi:hypothetical protein